MPMSACLGMCLVCMYVCGVGVCMGERCMCISIYVCMYVCLYVCMCVNEYMYICMNTYDTEKCVMPWHVSGCSMCERMYV